MARIKGKAKGGDAAHGGIRDDVARFLDACRTLPAVRREAERATRRGKDYTAFVQAHEARIHDGAAAATHRRDSEFFRQVAARLDTAPIEKNVDEVTAAIQAIWELTQRPWDPDKKPRASILFPELLRELKECFPGRAFTDKRIREKAKGLGVVLGKAGRPRKSP